MNHVLGNVTGCLRRTPADKLYILEGKKHAELRRK